MKKKLIFRTLLLILLGNILIGCSSNSKSSKTNENAGNDDEVTVEFWNHWTSDGNEGQYFEEKIEEFEELNPGVKINQTNVPIDDYTGARLTTAFATGEGPDIFSVSPGTINVFVESGTAYPMDDYFTDELLADFSEESIDDVTRNDSIIAVPFEQDLMALFYDIDALEEAGIDPPTTWNEMIAAAEILTTDDKWGITYDLTKGAYGNFSFMPFVWQGGGDFIVDGKSHLNTEPVIEALTLWKTMVDNGSANLNPSRFASDVGILGDKETALWIGGSFGISALESDYPDTNVGVVPLPIPEGGTPASVAGGWKLMINNEGESEAAADFAEWLFLDEDSQNSIDWNTKAKFAYSPRQSVVDEASDIYQEGLRSVFTNEIYGTERPELSLDPESADIIGDMIQDALYTMTPEEAANRAHERLQNHLDNN